MAGVATQSEKSRQAQAAADYAATQGAAGAASKAEQNARKKAKEIADAKAAVTRGVTEKGKLLKQIDLAKASVISKTDIYNAYYKAHTPIDFAEQTQLNYINEQIANAKVTVTTLQGKLIKVESRIKTEEKIAYPPVTKPGPKIYNPKHAPGKTLTPSTVETPIFKPITMTTGYKYNAPMVSSAYLPIKGPNQISYGDVGPGNYDNARKAWNNGGLGRGVIQMDKQFVVSPGSAQGKASEANRVDPQLYGFKFLYNPSEVEMGWQIQQAMNPTFLASGADAFQIISADLLASTVSFTVLINRIADFSVKDFTTAYPSTVTNQEYAKILERGTMYDLEYLFKTLNGPSATFTSPLNFETADRGWLRPAIVELHLGDRLRYRVRLATFGLKHSMFTDNMVPTLTSVSLTFARFNDAATTS